MTESRSITLLALLVALDKPELYLNSEEREALRDTAQQLLLDPGDWDFIKEGLMGTIEANSILNSEYHDILSKLQAVGNIPSQTMPTQNELEAELPSEDEEPESRGYFEGEANKDSDEILNVAINVLNRKEPEKMVKNLSFIKRLKDFISKKQNS
jgi:hypothetical protein